MDLGLDWKSIGMAVGGMGTMLIAGKFLKVLILWPFDYLARRSKNKAAEALVEIAEKDLGVEQEVQKLEGGADAPITKE